MTGAVGVVSTAVSTAGTKRADWIPKQHGAWAMLAVPYLAGVITSGGSWRQLPLGLFWLAGYFAFYAGGVWVRSRRKPRYRPPVLAYGAVAAVLAVVVVVTSPGLLVWVPPYAVIAAVSLWFSSRRDDRALANDAVTMLAACLFALVTYQAAYDGASWSAAWSASWSASWSAENPGRVTSTATAVAVAVLCYGYFLGTALYVKTLIRERTSTAYHRASIAYHAAWSLAWALAGLMHLPGVGSMGSPVGTFFAVLTVRAAAMAGRRVRPLYVGLGEIVASIMLLILVALWH